MYLRDPPKWVSTLHRELFHKGGYHCFVGPQWRVPVLGRSTMEGTTSQVHSFVGMSHNGVKVKASADGSSKAVATAPGEIAKIVQKYLLDRCT